MRVDEVDPPHPGVGEIRIRVIASALSPGEVRIRSGALRAVVPVDLPHRTGFDAAGVVDEVGADVSDIAVGDEVFGMADPGTRGANADIAVLSAWARKPTAWDWSEAAGAAGAAETATRVLDHLGVGVGDRVLVNGASGGTGSVVTQMAIARGASVIGTASERNRAFMVSLGATWTTYGSGLPGRLASLGMQRVEAVVDCAGGNLAELVAIAGDPGHVVTIADTEAAAHGVRFSHGGNDRLAVHGLEIARRLGEEGRLRIPVAAQFALTEIVAAHQLSESQHAPGKIVLDHRSDAALDGTRTS
jgi:NADPH:quinone reductase-like Zn-dependent oxidoreductase